MAPTAPRTRAIALEPATIGAAFPVLAGDASPVLVPWKPASLLEVGSSVLSDGVDDAVRVGELMVVFRGMVMLPVPYGGMAVMVREVALPAAAVPVADAEVELDEASEPEAP